MWKDLNGSVYLVGFETGSPIVAKADLELCVAQTSLVLEAILLP